MMLSTEPTQSRARVTASWNAVATAGVRALLVSRAAIAGNWPASAIA